MSSRQLNRRAILAGAAALVPAAALAATLAAPDPTFAAIEEHRRLHDDFMREFRRVDSEGPLGDVCRCDRILEADDETHWRLLDTEPTTPDGIAALVRYAQQQDTDGEFWPEDWHAELLNVIARSAETTGAAS